MYVETAVNSYCTSLKHIGTKTVFVTALLNPTVQVKLHKTILLLHNEMDQQPIHHFENKVGEHTITHLSV